jgi:hypothetical protein
MRTCMYLDQVAMEKKSIITLGVTNLLLIAAVTCVVLVHYQPEKVSCVLNFTESGSVTRSWIRLDQLNIIIPCMHLE